MIPIRYDTVIALFVRQPIAGQVKTRLAHGIGDDDACELYRAMVADRIAQIKTCGLPLFLFHDGQDAVGLPNEWVLAADEVFRQEGHSLGDRMAAAFERSFSAGAGKVILAGSDIPGIDDELLRSAAAAVENHDVVFSPAFDGGYCLVASRRDRFNRIIFDGIPWSTALVMGQTIEVCTARGLSYALLDPRQDIDTMDDLADYCRNPSESAPATNAWLRSRGLLKSP
ncbi:MAG: TIGR04282 family arsenosugar biosynthesis glycosyltransferase [Desulfuromonadales bacterium]|nr:TIGR04282 family arsenosugar biosynthesis glycosyltransferase [Desulfuromonadales bacterium]